MSLSATGPAVGCSPFHLARLFRRETGTTLHRNLNRLRLRSAPEHLAGISLETFHGTGHEPLHTEVQVHGDLALVHDIARHDDVDDAGEAGSLPLRSVDIDRRGSGGWIQAGSHITPIPRGAPGER